MTQEEGEKLSLYRASIDNIDAALIYMLAERFKITKKIGAYKKKMALTPEDPARETRQIKRLRALSVDADLDPGFSEKFLRFVIKEVIQHHSRAKENDVTQEGM